MQIFWNKHEHIWISEEEIIKKYFPEFMPDCQEISEQMRIDIDILKQEITDQVDKELRRLYLDLEKDKEKDE